MIDLDAVAKRGNFRLQIACKLAAPWTVLFGPSGAGKSTLLRLIAGLEHPDSGTIVLNGKTLTSTADKIHLRPGARDNQRSIAMVTQRSALFPHISVVQNVAYGLAGLPLNRKDREWRVQSMLSLVGASSLMDRSPANLSGGEAQRVSLARALAPMPSLLLLDEPLSALDTSARDQVLTSLQAWLGTQGIQTILVTHDPADALSTNAEVVKIQEGKLIAQGPAAEVLASERQRILNRLNAG